MCELVSGFINIRDERILALDMNHHSGTQELAGWDSEEIQNWREWEYTGDGKLEVRVLEDDEHNASWWKAIILAKWPTWSEMFVELCKTAIRLDIYGRKDITDLPDIPKIKTLYCDGCTSLAKLDAPAAEILYCNGCTALTQLDAPAAEILYCNGCTALTQLDAPVAKTVYCRRCTGLAKLDAPVAKTVDCNGCTSLTQLDAPAAVN